MEGLCTMTTPAPQAKATHLLDWGFECEPIHELSSDEHGALDGWKVEAQPHKASDTSRDPAETYPAP